MSELYQKGKNPEFDEFLNEELPSAMDKILDLLEDLFPGDIKRQAMTLKATFMFYEDKYTLKKN